MTQSESGPASAPTADTLDTILGVEATAPLGQLRAQRPEATTHTQGSYQALFVDDSATSVSSVERFATALRVVALHAEPALVEHYAAQLRAAGADAAGL